MRIVVYDTLFTRSSSSSGGGGTVVRDAGGAYVRGYAYVDRISLFRKQLNGICYTYVYIYIYVCVYNKLNSNLLVS